MKIRNLTCILKNHLFYGESFRVFFIWPSLWSINVLIYWSIIFLFSANPVLIAKSLHYHIYEMLVGVSLPVTIGYLLTSAFYWTGNRPLVGKKLFIIFLFWFLARMMLIPSIMVIEGSVWFTIVKVLRMFFDISYVFLAVLAFSLPLIISKIWNNIQIVITMFLILISLILYHLDLLFNFETIQSFHLSITIMHLLLFNLITIANKMIPFFIKMSAPNINLSNALWPSKICILVNTIFTLGIIFSFDSQWMSLISMAAFIINFFVWILWKPWKGLDSPLLWILTIGYLCITFGFLFSFLSYQFHLFPLSLARHTFNLGAFGALMLGMMCRVSFMHTRNVFKNHRKFKVLFYHIIFSGFFRIAAYFFPLDSYYILVTIAALLWVGSYFIFVKFFFRPLIFSNR